MNNDILNSAFTFGIFLILVGIISKFFNFSQANTLFWMGVAFEVFALIIFLYRKLKK